VQLSTYPHTGLVAVDDGGGVNSRVMYTTQSRIDVYHSNVFVAA